MNLKLLNLVDPWLIHLNLQLFGI